MSTFPPKADIVWDMVRIMKPVTIPQSARTAFASCSSIAMASVKAIGLARRTARNLASDPFPLAETRRTVPPAE